MSKQKFTLLFAFAAVVLLAAFSSTAGGNLQDPIRSYLVGNSGGTLKIRLIDGSLLVVSRADF